MCQGCGTNQYYKALAESEPLLEKARSDLKNLISVIPVVSIHAPIHWDYDVVSIVTAQSTTGTGVITEIASSWTDFFGLQSGFYNRKLRGGEELCLAGLRTAALELGGNAVIGCDIDYAEVGGVSSMIMVCMTGTAIRLKNPDIMGADFSDRSERCRSVMVRLRQLEELLKGSTQASY